MRTQGLYRSRQEGAQREFEPTTEPQEHAHLWKVLSLTPIINGVSRQAEALSECSEISCEELLKQMNAHLSDTLPRKLGFSAGQKGKHRSQGLCDPLLPLPICPLKHRWLLRLRCRYAKPALAIGAISDSRTPCHSRKGSCAILRGASGTQALSMTGTMCDLLKGPHQRVIHDLSSK